MWTPGFDSRKLALAVATALLCSDPRSWGPETFESRGLGQRRREAWGLNICYVAMPAGGHSEIFGPRSTAHVMWKMFRGRCCGLAESLRGRRLERELDLCSLTLLLPAQTQDERDGEKPQGMETPACAPGQLICPLSRKPSEAEEDSGFNHP